MDPLQLLMLMETGFDEQRRKKYTQFANFILTIRKGNVSGTVQIDP